MRSSLLLLSLLLAAFNIPGLASPLTDAIRQEAERANARLERLREAYAKGAVSRRELEEAEEEARDLERRLRNASREPRELDSREARRRVEEARYDYEKAAAKASKLRALYEAGAVARNDAEAAQAAATQAEIYLKLNEELARRVEEVERMPRQHQAVSGNGGFSAGLFFILQDAYFREFRQVLPVSAFGPSETHEKMGFDHDGRIDIALHPDSAEGKWLISQLEVRHIPFIAFRNAVPGKATGAHIHLGFPSPLAGHAM